MGLFWGFDGNMWLFVGNSWWDTLCFPQTWQGNSQTWGWSFWWDSHQTSHEGIDHVLTGWLASANCKKLPMSTWETCRTLLLWLISILSRQRTCLKSCTRPVDPWWILSKMTWSCWAKLLQYAVTNPQPPQPTFKAFDREKRLSSPEPRD